MKKTILLLIFLFVIVPTQVMAIPPENEAEFLYNHKDNSSIKTDYVTGHSYIQVAPNDTYQREDGVTFRKNINGSVESSDGRYYVPIGTSNSYIPIDY